MIRKINRSERLPEIQAGQFTWRIAIDPESILEPAEHFFVPDLNWFNLGDARIDCLSNLSRLRNDNKIRSAYIAGRTQDGRYCIAQHLTLDHLNEFKFKKPNLIPQGFFFSTFKDCRELQVETLAKYDPDGESDMIHHTWKQLHERIKDSNRASGAKGG